MARLVAAALFQMQVLPTPGFVELGGAALLSAGLDALKGLFAPGEPLADGGCLFLDEFYQLNAKTDKTGASIVNFQLKLAEDMRDKLVIIVAGYGDEMDAAFTFNPGLPSRFPHHYVFEDFGAGAALPPVAASMAALSAFGFS